ncbi:hypothetical protein CYMTET_42420, partial [Cymbomonas tetramitiformis]
EGGAISAKLRSICKCEEAALVWRAVTPEMGKPGFEGPQCCQEVQPSALKNASDISLLFKRTQPKAEKEVVSKHVADDLDLNGHRAFKVCCTDDGDHAAVSKPLDEHALGIRRIASPPIARTAKKSKGSKSPHAGGKSSGQKSLFAFFDKEQ